MKRIFLVPLAAILLASCSMPGVNLASDVAAEKLAMTSADEKSFDALAGAVTVAANSAELLVSLGKVKAGSAEALKIDRLLDDVRDAVNRAYAVWRGTVTGDRTAAMREVELAFRALSTEMAKWSN